MVTQLTPTNTSVTPRNTQNTDVLCEANVDTPVLNISDFSVYGIFGRLTSASRIAPNGAVFFVPGLSLELWKTGITMNLAGLYNIENHDAVVDFISQHPRLLKLLVDLNAQLSEQLAPHAFTAQLQLVTLDADWKTLFVYVGVTADTDNCTPALDTVLDWLIRKYPAEYKFVNIAPLSIECLSTH